MPSVRWIFSRIFSRFQFRDRNPSSKPARLKRSRTERRARAEAALWVARLYNPQRNRNAEAEFRMWLTESAEHAAAFKAATEAYERFPRRVANQFAAAAWKDRRRSHIC